MIHFQDTQCVLFADRCWIQLFSVISGNFLFLFLFFLAGEQISNPVTVAEDYSLAWISMATDRFHHSGLK